MAAYRKKPVVIDAFMIGRDSLPGWFMGAVSGNRVILHGEYGEIDKTSCDIVTLEGVMHGSPGDFIIQGVKGEIYPCKPDIFAATYEPA